MTPFDALHALPPAWQTRMAGRHLVPVTTGMSGAQVFRITGGDDDDGYLKIGTGTEATHLRGEAERTGWLATMGIRVPQVTAQWDGTDAAAIMMTALDGAPADRAGADWQPAVAAIAQAVAGFHALPPDTCRFDETLAVRLARARDLIRRGGVDASQFDDRNAGVTPEDLYRRLAANIPSREDLVVVHGDATLANLILGSDGAVGFIDCGHCGRGDRHVDLAPLLAELAEQFGPQAPSLFLEAYGAPKWDEVRAAYYRDLYELF